MINKQLALDIIELLSAMESVMLNTNTMPDYLHENLANILEKLRKIILQ